ncbi:thioredoxin-like protein [Umbelopsis sp. AD052]|nr:thioredoxin-like protein [Umbelopsis sp. AD052]
MDDPNADTEWNDILRARGILPPKDEKSEEEINDLIDEVIAERVAKNNSLDDKTLDELDELEDDMDDRILLEYRMKRMQEMQQIASKEKYGEVRQISKPDFVREVTEASKECSVIVHLYNDSIPACKLMSRHLSELAQRYKAVKFLKIVADQCIPNYPDRNVPTLLVYVNGDIRANMIGAVLFGGMKMTVESLRKQLVQTGALPVEAGDQEEEQESTRSKKSLYSSSATAALSDDEDDEYDDRGYTNI